MNKLLVFLLICFVSCANSSLRISPKKRGVDPVFSPYVKNYASLINLKNKDKKSINDLRIKKLSINFSNLEGTTIGRCYWLLNSEIEIEIDKNWWDNSSFLSKEFLIYHELEHCIRYRMHTNQKTIKNNVADYIEAFLQKVGLIPRSGYFKDGCPASIMNPTDAGEWCAYNHYEDYIQDIIDYNTL
jgi:hypothetical protein